MPAQPAQAPRAGASSTHPRDLPCFGCHRQFQRARFSAAALTSLHFFPPSWETNWGKAQNGRGARGPRNFEGTGRLRWHVCCRKNVPHGRCQGRGRRGWRGPSSPAKWAPDCLACTRRAERHAWLSRHTTVVPTLPLGVSPPSLTCFRDSHALSRFQPDLPPWAPAQLRSTLQFPRPCLSLCPRVDDMFPLY